MQQSTPTLPPPAGAAGELLENGRRVPAPAPAPQRNRKPRVKKLRLALILTGLSILAGISTVFGMMMAVSRDLPSLEDQAQYRAAKNSQLLADRDGGPIASLAGNQNRILVTEDDLSPNIPNAITAVEDRRFYDHKGVDYRGIARALYQDLRQQYREARRSPSSS
jgi:penicillin-binding protein 1A